MLVKRAAGGPASQPGGRRGPGAGKRPASLLNNALAAIKSFNAAGLDRLYPADRGAINRANRHLLAKRTNRSHPGTFSHRDYQNFFGKFVAS